MEIKEAGEIFLSRLRIGKVVRFFDKVVKKFIQI